MASKGKEPVEEESPAEQPKMILLRSLDGEEFVVEESLATRSRTIRNIIEDDCTSGGVPLPNVTGEVLARIVEFWKRHASGGSEEEEVEDWDAEFADPGKGKDMAFAIVLAANYLNDPELFDVACTGVAHYIKDMTVDEVRDFFVIANDYTPEEVEDEDRKQEESQKGWKFD